MPDRLHAFFGREHVGVFERVDGGAVFRYDETAPATPLSLSLARGSVGSPEIGQAYLDNLLPEGEGRRRRFAAGFGVAETDTFALLDAAGEDVAGAVSLTADPELPNRTRTPPLEASEDEIAYQVANMTRDKEAPLSLPDAYRPRMSLAGAQAKFSLAAVGNRWFWSSYDLPSTHIVKPPASRDRNLDLAEATTLDLARSIGIPAAFAWSDRFKGQSAFVTERWDRFDGQRIHSEDLAQALGISASSKYGIGADRVVKLLAGYGQERGFLRQLAYNIAIGNADAHGKNYSVILVRDQVELAPLYDSIPIFLYPQYDQRLAMPIGGARWAGDLSERRWIDFAQAAHLEAGMVLDTVSPVIREASERLPDALQEAGFDQNAVSRAAKRARLMLRTLGT